MAIDPNQLQQMLAQGVHADELHPPEEEGIPVLSGAGGQTQGQMPPGMPPGMEGGMPPEGQVDPDAQKFFNEKMLGHMDHIKDSMDEDPDFREGLARSNVGPELLSELAHWSKHRIMDLLKDMIESPELAQDLHSAYQKSIFHGRAAIEDWREEKFHKKSGPDEELDAGPALPTGRETTPNMDDEAGNSAMIDNDEDFIKKMSRKD